MRLHSLLLASTLLAVVSAAAPDFLTKFPSRAEKCGPHNNSTANAINWCQKAESEISSGCCIVDTAKWSEKQALDAMQEWCDSVSANATVRSLNCSPDTDYSDPYNLKYSGPGDDDESETTSSDSYWDSFPDVDDYVNRSGSSNSNDNNGLSRSAIVGIVMGIIGGVFVFIFVLYCVASSQRRSKPPISTSTSCRVPDREPPRQTALPVRGSTPPPVYSAPPPAYHA